MRFNELFELNYQEIQGEIASAMDDAGYSRFVQWQPVLESKIFNMVSITIALQGYFAGMLESLLMTELDNIMVASSTTSSQRAIFDIIQFLQKNAKNKRGISTANIDLGQEGYRIEKASIFEWDEIYFLVIKDVYGTDRLYHIFATPIN